MTTDRGIPSVTVLRHHIEVLSRRVAFLGERMDTRAAEGRADANSYDEAEVAALREAIRLLEVEWDDAARLRRLYERSGGSEPRRPLADVALT